jgi:hypothetical protein
LEAQSLLKGSSYLNSSKNGAKNVRRHFSFKYLKKCFAKVQILWRVDGKAIFRLSLTSDKIIFDLKMEQEMSQFLGKSCESILQ